MLKEWVDWFDHPVGWIVLSLCFLLVLSAALLIAEADYRYGMIPVGGGTVADHFKRFGTPRTVREVRRKGLGETHFELQGWPGGRTPLFTFPSDPPAYIYNGNGYFVDWREDPGDKSGWQHKWQRNAAAEVDVEEFRRRFVK